MNGHTCQSGFSCWALCLRSLLGLLSSAPLLWAWCLMLCEQMNKHILWTVSGHQKRGSVSVVSTCLMCTSPAKQIQLLVLHWIWKLHSMTKHSSDRRQKYHIIGQKTTFSTTPTYSENLTISSCTLKCLLYFLYLFTFLSQNLGSLHFSMSSNFLQYLIYARINKRHYICIKEYFRIMFGTKKTRDQIHTSTIFENLSPSGGFSDSSCD